MRTLLVLSLLVGGTLLAQGLLTPDPEARPQLTYHGDGTLKSSTFYVDGVREGPAEQFYADGTPQSRGSYAKGEREGPWTFWTPEGVVDDERSGHYRAGVKVEESLAGYPRADS